MGNAPTPQVVAHISEVYALRSQVEHLTAEVAKYKALMRKNEYRAKRTWRQLQEERENSLTLAALVKVLAQCCDEPCSDVENDGHPDAA